MLKLINHPQTDIAEIALETVKAVKAWGAGDARLARQHVADLKALKALPVGSLNWTTALERLQKLPIADEE